MLRRRFVSFLTILFVTVLSVAGLQVLVGSYLGTPQPRAVTTHVPLAYPRDTLGLFRAGTFLLKNSLKTGPADKTIKLGTSRMIPVIGDWDGDGIDTVGVYDPTDGRFMLQNVNQTGVPLAYNFLFGVRGGIPVSGDWTGSGRDSVGVYASGVFYLKNTLYSVHTDERIAFGERGDVPIAGNWAGQGHDSVGIYRPSTGVFYLTNKICNCTPTATYVISSLGPTKSMPIAGDWTQSGHSGVGVLSWTTGRVYLRSNATHSGPANFTYGFGAKGDVPIAGHWSRPPTAFGADQAVVPRLVSRPDTYSERKPD